MRQRQLVSALAIAALLVAGCGDDGASESSPQEDVDAVTQAPENPEETGRDADTEAPESAAFDLTMEDGFNGPLHVDHDHAPGTGMVAFGGDEFAVSVGCDGFPMVEESGTFVLRVFAESPDADDDEVNAEITRLIRPSAESYTELLRVGHVVDSIPQGSAATSTDPAAEPVVRVLEDGRFSAIAEMQAVSERAPDGETVFVGRCDW